MGELLPIGSYTIPEISYVGRTEEELTAAAVPYEVGVSLPRAPTLAESYKVAALDARNRLLAVERVAR